MCPRGTFIVPSFDEIWPQPGKERSSKARARMGYDYILEAMQHHGLGHLPQPDNFTTCGRSPNTPNPHILHQGKLNLDLFIEKCGYLT